jgi:HD-like signal output (HDOD) protein
MHLVFVDSDPHAADAHRRALRSVRPEWTVTSASDVFHALEALRALPTDVFIADLGTPASDGVALFETVAQRSPATVRIALSNFTERSIAIRLERCAHRFVHKPCDTFVLAMLIERSTTLRARIANPAMLTALGGLTALPRPPVTVQALEKVLADPHAGVMQVAAVVSRDAPLSARVLRVVNSSFFGVAKQVTRVDAAVNFMGVSLVRAVALADGIVRSFAVRDDVLDLDDWNTHAVRVATAAREIALAMAPQNRALADEAFLAGLLHDVGQVVLAGVLPEEWRAVSTAAARDRVSLSAAEQESPLVSHAVIGAYLLSLWGLPSSVVEAVAFHHAPSALPGALFDATIATHIADAIVSRAPGQVAPALDVDAIAACGVSDSMLERWRTQFSAAVVAA